jgi:hypothetical protein
MLLDAYFDESYVENGNYYVGALVVDPVQSRFIKTQLDSLAEYLSNTHGVSNACEFHGHALFQLKDEWQLLQGKRNTAKAVYKSVLKSIAGSGGLLFFHGIDTVLQKKTYPKIFDPHIVAMQCVLEAIQGYAEKHDVRINVIADQVKDQHDHDRRIKQFQSIGTIGYKRTTLDRINLPFLWADSKQHRNLQAIDMCVFMHRRKFAHKETNELSRKAVVELRNVIEPAVQHQGLWTPRPRGGAYIR